MSRILMKGHIFRYQQFRTMTQTNIPDIKKKKKKKSVRTNFHFKEEALKSSADKERCIASIKKRHPQPRRAGD